MKDFKEWRAEVEKAKVLKGMTTKDLARGCGYSYKYMSNVLLGKQMGQPCVEAISITLGIDAYRYRPEDLSLIREAR